MQQKFDKDGAIFSEDRKYRYALFRMWDIKMPSLMFIGLNPSTANEVDNDPTIRRVIRFAQDNDYGAVCMLNLFALVSPNPADLLTCDDPIGENDKWLINTYQKCDAVVFAWGAFPQAKERAQKIINMFPDAMCLGVNKDGSPKHPLYLPANTPFENFGKNKRTGFINP
jgi:hypothetical protein